MMSSLFIGATGLKAHGEGMGVVSNNLANVNTLGFKQTMMMYQDLVSQEQCARSNFITNISQKGMGAFVGETRKIFTAGGFENGSAATDIAISGIGFYGVTHNGVTQYTRAGNFRFTKDGDLVSPDGWNLLGRMFRNGKEGATAEPISLDFSTGPGGIGRIDGKATENLSAYAQLGGVENKHNDPANPYFSMAAAWDGTQKPPLASYGYRQPLTIYDNDGNARQAYIYYDYVDKQGGVEAMEYVIGMDPADDASGSGKGAGLIMAGTVSFSSGNQLINVTGFQFSGNDPTNLSSYTAAPLVKGTPTFTVNFTGAGSQTVALDMGLTLSGSDAGGGFATAAAAAATPADLYDAASGATRKGRASTAYGSSPAEIFQSNDGYPEGYLRGLEVDKNGVLSGSYSNGETLDLARITLYRFTSQDGLRREGSNRFSATPDAGDVQEGVAGTENFGTLAEWTLEQSNVDYAREFTTMIITQRGFQMNSKVVTTSDQMLQKALELKR